MNRVVIVSGLRTPFLRANTQFNDLNGFELLRHSLLATVNKVPNLTKDDINYVVSGQTMAMYNSNIARDAVLTAGFDVTKTPAHTVTQACISANQAITSVASLIATGQIECGIGCGVDALSDPPIRLTRAARKWLLTMNKTKGLSKRLAMFLKARPSMIYGFEAPPIAEFTTDETMGQSCDRVTKAFGVTREDQDRFGLRSHELAAKASESGLLSDVSPMCLPKIGLVDKDNGIRLATYDSVAKLKPAFTKSGTATASNSSFLTDGASSTLLMSYEKARKLGLKPEIVIKDYIYAAIDPKEHLLLGPAHAITRLLAKNRLRAADIDVYELHEAFSGQVLANLRAMDSSEYSQSKIGAASKVGDLPMDRLNAWGGSVSLGHPFGATGSRLVNMAANRLLHTGGKYAMVSACAGGALGHAMIIENIS
ncbi:trifunctional enzyme subunit beta, mitochondrial-like [Oppia nitens]|uniref:trifunctional enzyme subunit beta, mitochondrial-like n=1 Tax=Oppia nitens TaxID=1686743 RepID=UPI0023DB1AE2|nr:trifunctional enzyme subunit beta, mitochondrial-like [Oppia nitens]